MSRRIQMVLLAVLVAILPGCADRIDLEDATLNLMFGIDLNEKNELLFYMSSPVFSKEAKKKTEEFGVKAGTIRESRARFDEMVTAMTVPEKIQLIVLGKKLLQHPEWFSLLDLFFREARFTVNARMVVVDGDVHSLFHFNPPDKPRLALHLSKLIDTSNRRNLTVKTRAQEFHRQMYEKGMTASITQMRMKTKKKVVEVMGTALLDKKGTYATLLEAREATLLQMLLHGKQGEISLTIPVPEQGGAKKIVKKKLSFYVNGVSKKMKVDYVDGRFQFNVKLKLRVAITERMFPFDMDKGFKKMERMIEEEVTKELNRLIAKCQKVKTDPFGFGIYARAYQYDEWKKVEDQWTDVFAKAAVNFETHADIKGNGVIK